MPRAGEENRIWRAAAYIRLSREDGGDESESVTNQKQIILEYLRDRFGGRHELTGIYSDDGLSGTDDSREQFARMVRDIELGQVDLVICKTLSRAFRNYSDQGYYLEYLFPRRGVRFICLGDPQIDTFEHPEALTGLEVPITGIMNDRLAARTSSDVRRTLDAKRRRGEFIGAFAPYGYLKDPENKNHLIIDPEIREIKREVREWIVRDSMSLMGAARRLNELKIPNPSAYKRQLGLNYRNPRAAEGGGSMWSATSLKRVLLNRVNLGRMEQGKSRVVSYKVHDVMQVPESEWFSVPDTHEPTFTREEYDQLAAALSRPTRAPNGAGALHPFSGLVRCPDCGRALSRSKSKGIVYYSCRAYGGRPRCAPRSIRLDALERAVLYSLNLQLALIEDLPGLVGRLRADADNGRSRDRLNELIFARQRERGRLEAAIDSLYVDWKAGDITADEYHRMKGNLGERAGQLKEIISRLEAGREQGADGGPHAGLLGALARGALNAIDRGLLLALVDTIYLNEDRSITIRYRFSDPYAQIT